MMNLLYIVGQGSKRDNVELRWSLRSVERFGHGVGRVIVAGYPPEWLSGEVERLPVPDVRADGKNRSIVNCVVEAVLRADLRGDFVFAADDVFLYRPLDFEALPRFVKDYDLPDGPKPGELRTHFVQMLIETRQFLRARGLPSVNFQTHAFVRMSADVIRENEALLRSTVTDTVRGLEILSLVGNLSLAANMATPVAWRRDVKFGASDFVSPSSPDAQALLEQSRQMFSISDATFGDGRFTSFMAANFGEPCRYERTEP